MQKLIIFGAAFIATIGLTVVVSQARANSEALLKITECTNLKWEEYERRTGAMPSIETEQTWYKECSNG